MAVTPEHLLLQNTLDASAKRAIDSADPNVLRMALYQLTRDPALEHMEVVKVPVRGGVLEGDALAVHHHEQVRAKAFDFIRQRESGKRDDSGPPPSEAEAYRLMRMFSASQLDEKALRYGLEELAFEDFPREVKWNSDVPIQGLDQFNILIIGAGISGIALGVTLNNLGINYSIVDKNPGIGGTWWTNDYPDCRVDVASHLYQFKFEKKYPWAEYYASRDANLAYINHVAIKYNVAQNVKLDTEVISAEWLGLEKRWRITVSANGVEEVLHANVLISAVGLFATPKLPDIPGIETFEGAMFHTTQWNHDFDYTQKRVALIGNGSTGSQLMPGVAAKASHLTVFQRTPQWVMPAENYREAIPATTTWLFDNIPFYWNWYCYSAFSTTLRLEELQVYDRAWQATGGLINQRNDKLRNVLLTYINSKVGDRPDLHSKVIPSFAPLGRRSVVDNGWYDALRQENVDLVISNVERFTPTGIVTSEGKHREFDLIILAAGFQTSKFLWPVRYVGRDGITLESIWNKDGPRSYMGITLPGFPNFFISYGPNGQPRAGGFYSWAEIWARYTVTLIVRMLEGDRSTVEVKREVFDRYNERQDAEMSKLIWLNDSAKGYYVNEYGRVGLNVPWETNEYHSMVADPNLSDFDFG